ncbi:MAG: lysophospholipid acyltransferase family protein [Pseudomonadota bacterium]
MRWAKTASYFLQMLAVRILRAALSVLGPRTRGAMVERLGRFVVMAVPGLRRRILDNLALIYPAMPPPQRQRLAARAAGRSVRNMYEILENHRLVAIRDQIELVETPGLAALLKAHDEGRGVFLISGHFGRFDAGRAALMRRGVEVGAVYRPQNNPFYNAELIRQFAKVGGPMLPRGRAGTRQLIRHMKGGGVMAVLIDQRAGLGESLDFMGQPAMTSTDIAELALRLNLLVVPGYAVRIDDGLNYRVEIEPPVPHTDPVTMTQALNDSLAARVHADPSEWYWLHRRWAPPKRTRADTGANASRA